jgi:hypothetical protein
VVGSSLMRQIEREWRARMPRNLPAAATEQ